MTLSNREPAKSPCSSLKRGNKASVFISSASLAEKLHRCWRSEEDFVQLGVFTVLEIRVALNMSLFFPGTCITTRAVRALGKTGLRSEFCRPWGLTVRVSASTGKSHSDSLVPVNLAAPDQVFPAKCVLWHIRLHSLVLHQESLVKTHSLSARAC